MAVLLGHSNVRLVGNSQTFQAVHNESLKFVIEVSDLMLASIPGPGPLSHYSPLSPSPALADSTFQVPASLLSLWGGSHFPWLFPETSAICAGITLPAPVPSGGWPSALPSSSIECPLLRSLKPAGLA